MKYFTKILALWLCAFMQIIFAIGIAGVHAEGGAGSKHKVSSGEILVSEKPLGASNCRCAKIDQQGNTGTLILQEEKECAQHITQRLYVCETPTVYKMIQGITQWVIQISFLLGVLAIAILGVVWTITGGEDPEYKKKLKEWLVGLIVGMILIYGFPYILGMFDWIYQ